MQTKSNVYNNSPPPSSSRDPVVYYHVPYIIMTLGSVGSGVQEQQGLSTSTYH